MWSPKILLALGLIGTPFSNAQNENANRALVQSYADLISNREYDAILDLFTSPDAAYWLNGSPARTGISGNSTIGELLPSFPETLGGFDRFTLTPTTIVAEGDMVMMEGLGRGEGPGTFLYLQTVVMAFRIADGKFDSVREYLDHQEFQYLLSYRERYAQL